MLAKKYENIGYEKYIREIVMTMHKDNMPIYSNKLITDKTVD